MTKREARIQAMRIATGMMISGPEEPMIDMPEDDWQKVRDQMKKLSKEMEHRAEKLGGKFNRFTGEETAN